MFDAQGVERLRSWLEEAGAEFLNPTNPYEVLRYKVAGFLSIVYRKKSGQLTFTGQSRQHWRKACEGAPAVAAPPKMTSRQARNVRHRLRERDGDGCWFCGEDVAPWEGSVAHLIPRSQGGSHALSNLCLSHVHCNNKAADLPLAAKLDLRMSMRTTQGD